MFDSGAVPEVERSCRGIGSKESRAEAIYRPCGSDSPVTQQSFVGRKGYNVGIERDSAVKERKIRG